MKWYALCLFLMLCTVASAQGSYADSLNRFRTNYVNTHDLVKGADRSYLQFYAPDSNYRVWATVEFKPGSQPFSVNTSGRTKQDYRVYATLHFRLGDSTLKLPLYQSMDLLQVEGYKDYLFLPFTDATNGLETYEVGRYIDLKSGDIKDGRVCIDFNKAYNPYCAYADNYACPIPPKENRLTMSIKAGEKKFAKTK